MSVNLREQNCLFMSVHTLAAHVCRESMHMHVCIAIAATDNVLVAHVFVLACVA